MTDTKEKILMTALRLFARDGYRAVSVSAIAAELGITKGALYKHYKNKRHIYDSIVERMVQIDAQRAKEYKVPEEQYSVAPMGYERVSVGSMKAFTLAQFTFWSEDPFACDFRKMLALERYRSAEMARLYSDCLTAGPVAYMEDILRELMGKGVLKQADPRRLAVSFYAPLYLLVNMADSSEDKQALRVLLENHIDRFLQEHAADG